MLGKYILVEHGTYVPSGYSNDCENVKNKTFCNTSEMLVCSRLQNKYGM